MSDVFTQFGISTTAGDISKGEILSLLEIGLKENSSFAKYFADTVLVEIQRKLKNLKIQSSAIEIDGKAISEQINKQISTDIQKDVDITIKQTKDSIKKASVEANKTNSKDSVLNISSLLGQTPKMSLLTGMRYQKMARGLLDKIEKGLPTGSLKFSEISIGDIFRPVGGSPVALLTPKESLSRYRKWNKLQKELMEKISKAFPESNLSFKEISLGDIFRPVGMPFSAFKMLTIPAFFRWMGLQKDIIKNIRDKVKGANFTFSNITLGSIFGEDNRSSILSMLKWNKLQKTIIEKISSKVDEIDVSDQITPIGDMPKLSAVTSSKPGFKSLEEEEPSVRISGFTRDALKELSGLPGLNKATEVSVKQEDKKSGGLPWWVKALGMAAVGLLAGGVWTVASGLFDSGPFKGLKKLLGTLAIRLGASFSKAFMLLASKMFGGMFKGMAQSLVKVLTVVAPKATATVGRIGGNILKSIAGKLGALLKPLLGKLYLIGSIISFGYAFSRFKSGDIMGGMLDVASGIVGLVPGVGVVLATGISVLSAIRDMKTSQEERVKEDSSLGSALFKAMGIAALKLGAKFASKLKFIPFLGTALSLYEAYKNIKSGNILKGILNIASGLVSLIPGAGLWLGAGIDILNSFIKPKEKAEESVKTKGDSKGFFTAIKDWIVAKFKANIRYLPIFGTFIRLKESWDLVKSGNIIRGLVSTVGAISTLVPVAGIAMSRGIDLLSSWLESKESEKDTPSSEKTPPLWKTIKTYIGEKIRNTLKHLILFGTGLHNIFKGNFAQGFSDVTQALGNIPIIGQVFSTINSWIGQAQEESTTSITTEKPKSIFQAFKDIVYEKIKKGLNRLPWWLKRTMKFIPGLSSMIGDIGEPDEDGSFEDAPKPERTWYGRKKKPKDDAPLNDFIWRSGQEAQRFSNDDNIIGVKDKKVFDNMLSAMKTPTKDTSKTDNALLTTIQKLQNNIINLSARVEDVAKAIISQSQSQVGNKQTGSSPESNLAGIPEGAGDARDPAYMLRGRAWDRINRGYVVL